MSLIDDLRKFAEHIPVSHIPGPAEVNGVVGALVAYLEHGGEALRSAIDQVDEDADSVAKLFAPKDEPSPADAPAPAPAPEQPPAAAPSPPAPAAPAAPAADNQAIAKQLADLAAAIAQRPAS